MSSRYQVQQTLKSYNSILKITSISKSNAVQNLGWLNVYELNIKEARKFLAVYQPPVLSEEKFCIEKLRREINYQFWWLGFEQGLCGGCQTQNRAAAVALLQGLDEKKQQHRMTVTGKKTYLYLAALNPQNLDLITLDNALSQCYKLTELTAGNSWFLLRQDPRDNKLVCYKVKTVGMSYPHIVDTYLQVLSVILHQRQQELIARMKLMEGANQFCKNNILENTYKLNRIRKEQVTSDLNILSNFIT